MITATNSKWGKSKGIGFNQVVLQALNAKTGDYLNLKIKDNKVIITKKEPKISITVRKSTKKELIQGAVAWSIVIVVLGLFLLQR
ncbi:AbrB/MazE/SpoVT family DNA-binding domain-containing protein [Lactobacillus amylovorus]|uniref:AbrB/MazE/SpoVT family DNA-binding domain-containing protein n=1 Tax=Lactobacillus amylovorus TaxID=1604 RepID=UPI0021A2C07B|nr:hypothetical protein [Lactobacillus amylovorus]MCT3600954.1 hypothetical protein [Lactobacillus amylovorus]